MTVSSPFSISSRSKKWCELLRKVTYFRLPRGSTILSPKINNTVSTHPRNPPQNSSTISTNRAVKRELRLVGGRLPTRTHHWCNTIRTVRRGTLRATSCFMTYPSRRPQFSPQMRLQPPRIRVQWMWANSCPMMALGRQSSDLRLFVYFWRKMGRIKVSQKKRNSNLQSQTFLKRLLGIRTISLMPNACACSWTTSGKPRETLRRLSFKMSLPRSRNDLRCRLNCKRKIRRWRSSYRDKKLSRWSKIEWYDSFKWNWIKWKMPLTLIIERRELSRLNSRSNLRLLWVMAMSVHQANRIEGQTH